MDGSRLPRIVAEPDTADADYDADDGGVGNRGGGGGRSMGGNKRNVTLSDDESENSKPHSGRMSLKPPTTTYSSGTNSKATSTASASDISDNEDDEEEDGFERVDLSDLDLASDDESPGFGATNQREAIRSKNVASPVKTASSRNFSAASSGPKTTMTTESGKETRPSTAVPQSLEEAIRHYHTVLEEAQKIGVDSALSKISYHHQPHHQRNHSQDRKDEIMELARHETLRRLTRLTSELFHRSLETKQLYQLVHETVMSQQARVKQLERQVESYEILKRHKEEDDADLDALKERIVKVERIALRHAPFNDGGLLDAIEELKASHIETQKKHKKRRRKEELVAAGQVAAMSSKSSNKSSTRSPSKLSSRSPLL